MYKKTVLRRLLKLVDLEFDSKEQIEAFNDGSGMVFEDQKQARMMQTPSNDSVEDIFAGDAQVVNTETVQ